MQRLLQRELQKTAYIDEIGNESNAARDPFASTSRALARYCCGAHPNRALKWFFGASTAKIS
jgi:hypothetical protein